MALRAVWVLAAALTAVPLAANAADYRVVGESDKALTVVEAAIKTDSDGYRETVFYMVFAEPVSEPDRVQVLSAPLLIDCAGNRYRIGRTTTFRADLSPVSASEPHMAWRDVVAGSPFAAAADLACRKQTLPKADSDTMAGLVQAWLGRKAP
ncbi:MAG: hypothetical protein Q8L66_02980 [Caulobacter sp.]|nr:hypothetical protein [Caulobacter sp.]